MELEAFNAMDPDAALAAMIGCCAAESWAQAMVAGRPFGSLGELREKADEIAASLDPQDWLRAFAAHPLIGDVALLRARFATAGDRANAEQGQVLGASEATLERLALLNRSYHERHGFIFIVCAKGQSAEAMLEALEARLPRSTDEELATASQEQLKITHIRINDLFEPQP